MIIKKIVMGLMLGSMALFFIWQNNAISLRKINYTNPKIPQEFKGYTIAHVSDLHNKAFGKDQERLLKKVRASSPDMIVVTGDLIDRRRYNLDTAMVFIRGAVEIAPLYFVSGNHEAWSGDYDNISRQLEKAGAHILDDDKIKLVKGKGTIEILGLSDPAFLTNSHRDETDLSHLKQALIALSNDQVIQILLSHRPELFDLYADANIDLILSGHAHGGQVRLPFLGGLVAPNQGLLPHYTTGPYTKGESTLLVSRGLGNSIIPLRIFNRPELVIVRLK